MAYDAHSIPEKRKFEDVDRTENGTQTFTIKSLFPCQTNQELCLIPRYFLHRSQLPLAWLDLPHQRAISLLSRFYTGRIPLFENLDIADASVESYILVARTESSDQMFALERLQGETFAVSALKACEANKLNAAPTNPARLASLSATQRDADDIEQGWEKVQERSVSADTSSNSNIPRAPPDSNTRNGNFRLCMSKPQQKPVKEAEQQPSSCDQTVCQEAPQTQPMDLEHTSGAVLQPVDDVLKETKTHYQEALYLSKASLAYFAKGPLSRARANSLSRLGKSQGLLEMARCLRSSILPLSTFDKKYRETLPSLLNGLPSVCLSEGECFNVIENTKKKGRKSKKEKLGKDGLFPWEDVNITKWWLSQVSSVASDQAEDEDKIQVGLNEQRTRETKLQIILSLEILALETTAALQLSEQETLGDSLCNTKASTEAKKPKKEQDLSVLLELLADRLCIWQSMSASPRKSEKQPGLGLDGRPPTSSHDSSNDHLRQFCLDVIVPFYAPRIPQQSAMLCQKLGGPKQTSPKQPNPAQFSLDLPKADIKPGAPLQGKQLHRPRRTLERVLTDDKSHSREKSIPSLSRSITEPTIGQLKREVSETSLSSIPLNTVVMTKRYSQREVDLRANSQAKENKIKKKVAVEQELQGAIAALKRPNARAAVREFVEASELRQSSLKSKRTKRNPRDSHVREIQIQATPRKIDERRQTTTQPLSTLQTRSRPSLRWDIDGIPPSSIPEVSSPVIYSHTGKQRASANNPASHLIERTPTRGQAKLFSRPHPEKPRDIRQESQPLLVRQPSLLQPSPSKFPLHQSVAVSKSSIVQETFSNRYPPVFEFQASETEISATPCKQPNKPEYNKFSSPPSCPDDPDLYSTLGWNYDVDD